MKRLSIKVFRKPVKGKRENIFTMEKLQVFSNNNKSPVLQYWCFCIHRTDPSSLNYKNVLLIAVDSRLIINWRKTTSLSENLLMNYKMKMKYLPRALSQCVWTLLSRSRSSAEDEEGCPRTRRRSDWPFLLSSSENTSSTSISNDATTHSITWWWYQGAQRYLCPAGIVTVTKSGNATC